MRNYLFLNSFLMALSFLFLFGCRVSGCEKKKVAVENQQEICSLVRILGEVPTWKQSCRNVRGCRLLDKKRLNWVRCVLGRCMFSRTTIEKGHRAKVLALRFFGSSFLVSASKDGEIRFWSRKSGRTLLHWKAHEKGVHALVALPESKRLLSAGGSLIKLWSVPNKKLLKSWKVNGRILELAISSDRKWFAAASSDRRVYFSTLVGGEMFRLEGHSDAVRGVAFSPKGLFLASASDDRSIRIWSTSSHKTVHIFRGHEGWVRRVLFGNDMRQWIFSSSFDLTIRAWDRKGKLWEQWGTVFDPFATGKKTKLLPSSRPVRMQPKGHRSDISDLALSKDGRWLLSSGHRSDIHESDDDGLFALLWSRKKAKIQCRLGGHVLGVTRVAFSSNSSFFATASEDGTIRVYKIKSEGHQ